MSTPPSQFTNPIDPGVLSGLLASLKPPAYGAILPKAFGGSPIVKSFADLMEQANQANAARGQGILSLLAGQGQSQIDQNQSNFQDQLGGIQQDMISKGLSNTTVGNNLNQAAQNNLARSNEAVNEQTAGNLAGMANSFTQQAPDLGLLAQLLQNGGGAGPGGGGGFSGVVGPHDAAVSNGQPLNLSGPVGFGQGKTSPFFVPGWG